MTTVTANIINPTTKEVIGTTLATYWTDPVSGFTYKVPLGYDPQNTVDRFSAPIVNATQSVSAGADPATLTGAFAYNFYNLLNYRTNGILDLQRAFSRWN